MTNKAVAAMPGSNTSVIRAEDGRITYLVRNWGQPRVFCHWNDALALQAQLKGGTA